MSKKAQGKQKAPNNDPDQAPAALETVETVETTETTKTTKSSKDNADDIRAACVGKNPPGVYLIAQEPEKSAAKTAGYLQFDTISEFNEFIASEGWSLLLSYRYDKHANTYAFGVEVTEIITELREAIDKKFGMTGNKSTSVQSSIFHRTVTELKDVEWQMIESQPDLPLNYALLDLSSNDRRVMHLNHICAAFKLMLAAGPHRIEVEAVDVPVKHRGYSPESWNRGLVLSKHCCRQAAESRTASSQGAKKRQKGAEQDAVVPPQFLSAEEFATMRENRGPGAGQEDAMDDFYRAAQALEHAHDEDQEYGDPTKADFADADIDSSPEDEAEFVEAFANRSARKANSALDRKSRSRRPLMTKGEAKHFCEQ